MPTVLPTVPLTFSRSDTNTITCTSRSVPLPLRDGRCYDHDPFIMPLLSPNIVQGHLNTAFRPRPALDAHPRSRSKCETAGLLDVVTLLRPLCPQTDNRPAQHSIRCTGTGLCTVTWRAWRSTSTLGCRGVWRRALPNPHDSPCAALDGTRHCALQRLRQHAHYLTCEAFNCVFGEAETKFNQSLITWGDVWHLAARLLANPLLK